MGSELSRQAPALLLAALLGFGAGLLYDLLRPPRRALPRLWAALVDLFYGLGVFTGLFLFAKSAGDGRLGLSELSAALLGFLAWLHLLSPVFLPLCTAGADGMGRALEMLGKYLKNFTETQKKPLKNDKSAI